MTQINLHGHLVIHDEHDREGYDYLAHKIQGEEAKVLFEYAKEHGTAEFETHLNKNYSLVHSSDGTYTIVKR